MKNINIVLFKNVLILTILLSLNIFLITNIKLSPLKNKVNAHLLYENYKLKQKYQKLEQKIVDVESNLMNINNYDYYINSKILGLDIDTNYFSLPLIDTISTKEVLSLKDKISRVDKLTNDCLNKITNTVKTIIINNNKLDGYPNTSPIKYDNSSEFKISSKFGWRKHPIYKIPLFHKGVDIHAKYNTNIFSTMNGIVSRIKISKYGYGNHIIIKNEYGYETLYAHLSKIFVSKNDTIKKGDLIAKSGNSGLSTSPHLHYEVRENRKAKNPENYILIYGTYSDFLAKK